MNPFQLAEQTPRRPWLRLALGLLGALVIFAVARKVHWQPFRMAIQGLRKGWLAAFLLLAAAAMGLRALRLNRILGPQGRIVPVFRGVALGYLGMLVLPLGGGELLKMATLRSLLGLPSASVATGWVLDRVFEVLGVLLLLGLLTGRGVALNLKAGPGWAVAGAIAFGLLAFLGALTFRRRLLQEPRQGDSPLRRRLREMASVLAVLKRPRQVGGILAFQILVSLTDAASLWAGFQAFSATTALAFLTAVKLDVFLMVGAALPLLPGGMGTHQVACTLALQPAGVTHTEAFAFSVVIQGLGFLLMAALGLLAALWPGEAPAGGQGAPDRGVPPGSPSRHI